MAKHQRAAWVSVGALSGAVAVALALLLSSCGLGRQSEETEGTITDPVVAATVNGRPIYIEDVRRRAVQMGRLQEGENLSIDSGTFELTLEELIQYRLFAMEAEARGLDREPSVRRRLENVREQVLASAIYDELDRAATDPEAIERHYRENYNRLEQDPEIHLRHIQFETREEAEAAKRRLDNGERFEALAFELSVNRETAADGGDLGFRSLTDLAADVRELVERTNVGQVAGPVEIRGTWHLLRVEDIRERGAPSLESLRPRIVQFLRYQEIQQLYETLLDGARIERLREPDAGADPGGDVSAPADATPPQPAAPPATAPPEAPPGAQQTTPDFPFAPGGVVESAPAPAPASPSPATPAPAAANPPAQTPAEPPA